jgi:serine/threonine protein kinase
MATTGCPNPIELDEILSRSLDPVRDRALLDHLTQCPSCRSLLEGTLDLAEVERWRLHWKPPSRDSQAEELAPFPITNEPVILPEPFDGYEIQGVIGRGGMSVVYKARQAKLNRPVALKMLLAGAHASPKAIARLRDESETIARLHHPGIVKIYDIGEHQGVPYLCLELVEGGSLAARLTGQPIPPNVAARLVAILARVVHAAHERGVIHRDLKPANVLVDHPPGTPLEECDRVLLTDFGLAKRLNGDTSAPRTHTQDVLGTPAYMAPEQVLGKKAPGGPAVDVYGLGAILYELLSGQTPFRGESPIETALQVISRPPLSPRSLNPGIPLELETICLRCLEKDPARRPHSARSLAEELDGCLKGVTVAKPTGRHRALVAVVAAAAVIVAVLALSRKSPNSSVASIPRPAVPQFDGPLEDVIPLGQTYRSKARVIMPGVTDTSRPREDFIAFDLRDINKVTENKHRVDGLRQNAKIWDEPRHQMYYWGPEDDSKPFEVIYRFGDFGFPIRSAFLHAGILLEHPDSRGELQVTSDPAQGWFPVCGDDTTNPCIGLLSISKWVRGETMIYVKARLQGRDDGEESSLAQFLRTSVRPGDIRFHDRDVFELRVSPHEIPSLKLSVSYDETGWDLVPVESDGTFSLERLFTSAGPHRIGLRATVEDILPGTTEWRRIWVTTPGCDIETQPSGHEVKPGGLYRAEYRLKADLGTIWKGSIDYGDDSGEQVISPRPDGSFSIEHRYLRPGRHRIWIAFSDSQGRVAARPVECSVSK